MNKRLVILAVLAILVWVGIALLPEKKTEEPMDAAWTSLGATKVKTVEQRAGNGEYTLQVQNGEWRLQAGSGPALRADLTKVEALITFIDQNRPIRRLGTLTAEQAAEYGLDKPQAVLTMKASVADGKTEEWTLTLGAKNPSADGVYAKSSREGDTCLLLDARFAEQCNRKPDYYYDLRLVDMRNETIARVALDEAAYTQWDIARQDKGFVFTQPESLAGKPTDEPTVNLYLNDLTTLRGKSVLASLPEKARSMLKVSVWRTGSETPETVEVFETGMGQPAFAGRSDWQPAIVALDISATSKLARTAFSLRDRTVLTIDQATVKRMRIRQEAREGKPAAEFVVARTDAGWKREGEDAALTEPDMLLWQLGDLKFEAEPASVLPESAGPWLTWELFTDTGEPAAVLQAYSDPGLSRGQCWIKTGASELFYPVAGQLPQALQYLVEPASRKVLQEP